MLSLGTLFWLMILLFAIIGSLRGWTGEVIVTSGLILSLFAIDQFGKFILGFPTGSSATPERQRFYYFASLHLMFAFFSYQGPATIAGTRFGQKLKARDKLQDKLLGLIIGSLNGYLIIGALWSFLEYRVQADGNWIQLIPGEAYPFDATVLLRPDLAEFGSLISKLPLPMLSPYLPFLVVIVFLFVIIVMI